MSKPINEKQTNDIYILYNRFFQVYFLQATNGKTNSVCFIVYTSEYQIPSYYNCMLSDLQTGTNVPYILSVVVMLNIAKCASICVFHIKKAIYTVCKAFV